VRSERRHRLVITDTFSTGVILQVTGRLITLVDGTRHVAASQQMIHIGPIFLHQMRAACLEFLRTWDVRGS
jgi:hypothetical protein